MKKVLLIAVCIAATALATVFVIGNSRALPQLAKFIPFTIKTTYPSLDFSSISPFTGKEEIPPVTLEGIFATDHSWTATLSAEKKVVIVATGDVIPARSVNYTTIRNNDFTWGWKYIAPLISSGDFSIINLESPLVPNCPITNEGMVFCGDQRHLEGLLFAGVDAANFANNHMGNWGTEGVEETRQLLESSDIAAFGLGEVVIRKVKGTKIALVGFNDIGDDVAPIAKMTETNVQSQVAKARQQADVVIVAMHWGVEYVSTPDERMQQFAHLAIDSGGDLIIGNHPHWIESIELYKGKFIMYAHGNTIFDQMWSEETKKGVIGKYTFYDNKLVDVEFTPLYIRDFGQSIILTGEEKAAVLHNLSAISR